MQKSWWWIAVPATAMILACGSGDSDDKGKADKDTSFQAGASKGGAEKPAGVYKFGQSITFKDGSTLTVGKPVKFTRAEYAVGGDGRKVFLKFKSTFTNRTGKVFDPSLTTGEASADGVEGDAVFQQGLDAPDNKVLPGKSITWWMGYGFDSAKDIQLQVTVGFLDYGTVVYTN